MASSDVMSPLKKGKTERAHHERLVLWLIHA
jgi:hypothetical protein